MAFPYLYVTLTLAFAVVYCDPLRPPAKGFYSEAELEHYFKLFKEEFNRTYADSNEEAFRFNIFVEALRKVNELNSKYEKPTFGITLFSDMTEEEQRRFTFTRPVESRNITGTPWRPRSGTESLLTDTGETIDWRQEGIVSKVKNQGKDCGASWAFSAIGAIESQYAKHEQLLTFSEQQLIDCDMCATGCFGGRPDYSYLAIEEYGGINTESDYPYQAVEGSCKSKLGRLKATTPGYYEIKQDEEEIRKAVQQQGPVSLTLQLSDSLKYYRGGEIMRGSDCLQKQGYQSVLVVGYGTRNGVKYWTIKNSWGTQWGHDGYLFLERGVGACQIGMYASIPKVIFLLE